MTPRIAHLLPHSPTASELDLMQQLLGHAGLSLDDGLQVVWSTAAEVEATLAAYQPTLCLLWEQHGHMLRAMRPGSKAGLDDLKGYVWQATAVCPGTKCVATYHPARIRMEWGLTGVSRYIMARVAREAATTELVVPLRKIYWGWGINSILVHLRNLQDSRRTVAIDLEGGCGMGPACIGFAWSEHEALVVPFYNVDGESIWSEADELILWEAVQDLLEDPLVPKIIQNAAYELFVLAWTTGIVVQGLQDDTMCKGFELHCELEKSLEFLAMLYTRQPWWKLEHKQVDGRYVPFKDGRRATTEEWFVYNGTDCCVTYEVNEVMEAKLKPQQRAHYRWQVQLLTPLAYMSLRGMRFDSEQAKARLTTTQQEIYELQDQINQEAASGRPALQQFYTALGQPIGNVGQEKREGGAGNNTSASAPMGLLGTRHGPDLHQSQLSSLLPLFIAAFCKASPRVRGEVTTTSWQPKAWNGKKWVRKGKRVQQVPEGAGFLGEADEPQNGAEGQVYYQPIHTTKECNLPAKIETLEDVRRFAKDSCQKQCNRACAILRLQTEGGALDSAQRGELSTLLGIHLNVGSVGREKDTTSEDGTVVKGDERDAQWFLYTHCGFEKQYAKDGIKNTTKVTTDTDALLRIMLQSKGDPRCAMVLQLRAALTAVKNLKKGCDDDGRMRTSYNLVGTNTGRISSSESPTGNGGNLQNITKRDRDLFKADEGMELYSCDLSGADSWTVAAHAAKHNDRTMLDDLLGKLKPAKIVALMQLHGVAVNSKTRDELRLLSKQVPEDGGLYPASKATTHGSNYGMKPLTMARNILKQSYKKTGTAIVVEPAQCGKLQGFYFIRYNGVPRWQAKIARQLKDEGGVLTTPYGFQRKFFGRKTDAGTLRDALAFEPQANTTYVTNMMLHKLWLDPDNRLADGSLLVQPVHQVHDAAMFQGPTEQRSWIVGKVQEWFNTPIVIGGIEVLIPYEMSVGLDWKNAKSVV